MDVLPFAPGFDRARTDADLASLYRDNLEPDLAPFRRRGGLNIAEFKEFVAVRVLCAQWWLQCNGRVVGHGIKPFKAFNLKTHSMFHLIAVSMMFV